jgi:hypothetical protein
MGGDLPPDDAWSSSSGRGGEGDTLPEGCAALLLFVAVRATAAYGLPLGEPGYVRPRRGPSEGDCPSCDLIGAAGCCSSCHRQVRTGAIL